MPLVLGVDDEEAGQRAGDVLAAGGLVVAPVDGVYALIADAFADAATAMLRQVRGAAPDVPLTLLVRSHKQLPGVTSSVPEAAERLVAGFWPGPLTLVLPAAQTIAVDLGASRGTVAVRMPVHEVVREMVTAVGPLACSVAAPVAQPAPMTVADAIETFDDTVGAYLDAGMLDGARSTVVDCSRGGAEVLRRGALSADDVTDVATGTTGWGRASDETGEAGQAGPSVAPDEGAGPAADT